MPTPRDQDQRHREPAARAGRGGRVGAVALRLPGSRGRGATGPGGAGQPRQLCATLIQANGVDVLGVLAVPVLLAGVGLVAVRAGRRGILATVMVALVAFCLLALASVGLLYLPAAAALITAVLGWRQQLSAPPNR
jgi:hypothetical protein